MIGVVVKIRRQPFMTFPRGVAGGRILLPYILPTIGYTCYTGFNYSDQQLHVGIRVQPETLFEKMRRNHITLKDTSKNHHSLGKFSLHDTRSVLWTVCKPSIILRVALLILAKVFLMGKEPDCLWLDRMFHFTEKFLSLCQTIFTGYFLSSLSASFTVEAETFNSCDKALSPMPGSSKTFSADS